MISEEQRSEIKKLALDFISQSRSVLAELRNIDALAEGVKENTSIISSILDPRRSLKRSNELNLEIYKAMSSFDDLRGRSNDTRDVLLSKMVRDPSWPEDEERQQLTTLLSQFDENLTVGYQQATGGRLGFSRKNEMNSYETATEKIDQLKVWLLHHDLF